MRRLSPRNQEHKLSLFILVIIVGRLVILDQSVICWSHTGLGISRLLLKREILQNLLLINMSRPIGDIYLKKVKTLFCVRMLTLKLQSLSISISVNRDNLPTITVVSQDTSGHTVIRSGIKSVRSRSKNKTGKSSSKPSKPHHASRQKQQYPQRGSPSCCHSGKNGHTKAKYFGEKPHKPKEVQIYEGQMKNVLVSLDKWKTKLTSKNKVCA